MFKIKIKILKKSDKIFSYIIYGMLPPKYNFLDHCVIDASENDYATYAEAEVSAYCRVTELAATAQVI